MAEINSENPHKKKATKGTKLSTRVDLTPMVDLGFLLITFFIFTTTLSQPTTMSLVLPAEGASTKVSASKTLNLILAKDNTIKWYDGDNINNMHTSSYAAAGLRAVIMNKRDAVQSRYGNGEETVVLIKPTNDASYQNIVAALDEMQINNIKRCVLMDAGPEELLSIK